MLAFVMAVCAATCAGRNSSSATPTRRCDRNARAHLHRKRRRGAAPPCDTLRSGMCCIIVQRRTPSCNPQGCPTPVLQRPPENRKLAAKHDIVVQSMLGCIVSFDDSVEHSCDTDDMLQRLHRGSDDRLVSGHGDAFADRRHSSDGSRAHGMDEEPTTSRPACHRRLMLSRTRVNCVFL
jgi:hypothetical protein